MGHNICALISRAPIDEQKAKDLGLAVIYEGNYVIIPLVDDSIFYWRYPCRKVGIDAGNNVLWLPCHHKLSILSGSIYSFSLGLPVIGQECINLLLRSEYKVRHSG